MTRETRANLIFLCVIVCLMVPPIGMTLYKRWGKPGRLIAPPPVRDRLAYIDRTPGAAGRHLSRVVPPQTGGYVAQLTSRVVAMQRGLQSLVDGRFPPIMSENLNLQWIAEGAHDGKFRAAILAWSGRLAPLPKQYRVEGLRGGQTVPATLESYETNNLPIELRRELQNYGYIQPPDATIWIILAFDGVAPVEGVTFHYEGFGFTMDDVLRRNAAPATSPATMPTTSTAGVTP